MSVDWDRLLASGELARIAAGCADRKEFAAALGLTESALRQQMARRGLPSFSEIKCGSRHRRAYHKSVGESQPACDHSSCDYEVGGQWSCAYRDTKSASRDFGDEEPTNPAAPVFDVSDIGIAREPAAADVIPVGHFEKGRSTLMKDGRAILTWHKTTVSQQQHLDAIMRVLEEMPTWRGMSEPVEQVRDSSEDLLAVYCMGDPHLGLMTWGEETGTDHDLATGVRDMIAAVNHLVDIAPPADTGIVLSLGDLVHVDNEKNETTRGTKQDADTRWFKMMQETLRSTRCAIDAGKRKHKKMLGRIIRGNHDWHSSAMIAMGLAQYYENDPRVEIEVTPNPFSWFEFGKNLLGWCHTDECSKPEDLAGVMAVQQAEAWGRTIYRFMQGGHLHHQIAKETHGVLVERLPTLAPKCSWAHRKGYGSLQSMCVDTYHREWGRVNRSTVGIRQLRAA